MLRIICPPLSPALQAYLERQRDRRAAWRSLSDTRQAREVKSALLAAFHGKCGYCEQIEAQTVDHFAPQATDEARWDWNNYILACDVCQSKKLDRPPLDSKGRCMVNPRFDEPLRFLYFDFTTGLVATRTDSEEGAARGQITIQLLALDRRPVLQEERRRKLWDVLGHALRVVQAASPVEAQSAWADLRDHLRASAPYLGMIRQLMLTSNEYTPLIEALRQTRPDFDDLVQDWCVPIDR